VEKSEKEDREGRNTGEKYLENILAEDIILFILLLVIYFSINIINEIIFAKILGYVTILYYIFIYNYY